MKVYTKCLVLVVGLLAALAGYGQSFVPSDLPNLALWLKADAGVVTTGTAVTQWNDQSGNNYNALQTTAARQPSLVTVPELCNKPAVKFIDDGLNGALISNFGNSSITIFVLAKGDPTTATGAKKLFNTGGTNTGFWLFQNGAGTASKFTLKNMSATLTGRNLPLTGFPFTLLAAEKEIGVSAKVFSNGVEDASSTNATLIAPFTNAAYTIGQNVTTYFKGAIAEMIVYTSALNAAERQQVENYIYNKYAPPLNLGADTVIAQSLCPLVLNPGCFSSYAWSTGATTSQIQVTQSGNYSLTATDVFGRVHVDDIQVTFPSVTLNYQDTSVCSGQSLLLETPLSNSPGYSFLWQDGSTNPNFTANSAGDYFVRVTDNINGCFKVSETFTLSIDAVAKFNLTPACKNNPYSFTDLSTTVSSGNIVSWFWDFGDGNTSNVQHPQHTYDTVGNVSVSLTVTSANGCTDVASNTLSIDSTASFPVKPQLITPPNGFISASNNVSFLWSPSANAVKYKVYFSTDSTFNTIYDSVSTFLNSVNAVFPDTTWFYWKVIAYNICNDPVESELRNFFLFKPLYIDSNILWLTADSNVVLNPNSDSVLEWRGLNAKKDTALQTLLGRCPRLIGQVPCLNNKPVIRFDGINDRLQIPVFEQQQPLTAFVVWNSFVPSTTTAQYVFDGISTSNAFRIALYNNTDLRTYLYAGASTLSYPDTAPLNYRITAGICNGTNSEIFENSIRKSGGVAGTSALTGLNLGMRSNQSSFLNGDIAEIIFYSDNLSPAERDLVERYLRFKYSPPPVYLGPDIEQTGSLCPVQLQTNNCYSKYLWSTGETTPSIYGNKDGEYWVQVTDVFGGVSSDTIYVHYPYKGMNTYDTAVCVGSTVTLHPVISNQGYTFLWNTGSQDSAITISLPGIYTCTISDGTCSLATEPVEVVVDSFVFHSLVPDDSSMCIGNRIAIIPYVFPLDSIFWNTSVSDTFPVVTAVDSVTNYVVTAIDVNGCVCSDSIAVNFTGRAPSVDFAGSNGCTGKAVYFSDLSVPNADSSDFITTWHWTFGDGASDTVPVTSHVYDTITDYIVTLFITTNDGCTGYANKEISIYSNPTAAVSTIPQIICAETTVRLQDVSGYIGTTFLEKWQWKVNNTDTFSTPEITYNFPAEGFVPIELSVTTNQGCSDTVTDTLEVFPGLAGDFGFEKVCLGETVQFTDLTPTLSIVRWSWNFGDQTPLSAIRNPSHKYSTTGTRTVRMIIENAIGCVDTISKSVLVVDTPNASFTNLSGCEDDVYVPVNNSTADPSEPISVWYWEIDNTVYTNNIAPQHQFPETGTYDVKLKVTTSPNGCVDSVIKQVTIEANPTSFFTFTPLYGEAPLEIEFSNLSSDADGYDWSFGDNSTNSSAFNPTHVFNENDTFTVSLFAVSDAGCSDIYSRQIIVVPTTLDIAVSDVMATAIPQQDGSVITSITARLTNEGTRLIVAAQLYATIDGEGLISETFGGLLERGHDTTYQFSAGFVTTSLNSNSYVCVEAKSVNNGETETRLDNNMQCTSLTGAIQLIGPIPNPAYGQSVLGIVLPRKGAVYIAVVDAIGRYIVPEDELTLPEGRSDYELPVKQMMAGEYFIRVKYNDNVYVKKLILK